MTDAKYSKALFLGAMKDGSVEKKAAMMARKIELDKFASNKAVSVSDRSSALREMNQISRDLAVNKPAVEKKPETPKKSEAAVQWVPDNEKSPAYKVEFSAFPVRRRVEAPAPAEELAATPVVEEATRNIQQNAENIMIQANMTRPEVISLIM